MRKPVLRIFTIVLSAFPNAALADAPIDLPALEEAWHACVRDAYAHQPPGQSRAGDQRNALDECREHEDRLITASSAVRHAEDQSLTPHVRAWAAAMAASVIDPVTAWLKRLRR